MNKAFIAIGLIVFYFIINAVIIKLLGRKQEDLEEYGVGGRSFGWLLNTFSYIGGWYCGTIYTGWFSNSATIGVFAQYVLLYSISGLVIMFLMARPVWVWGKVYNLETQGDLIELRYGSKKFKFIFAFLTFIFWSPWLILEIKTIGYVVQAATYQAIGFNIGLIIVSLFVIGYSFLGGARATAVGGLVQGLTFTIVGVIAVYYLIVRAYGGIYGLYDVVEKFNPALLTLGALGGKYWASVLITCTLGGFTLPGIFVRIYMADSPRSVKKAVLIAPIIGILIGYTILALGMGGLTFDGFPADAQAGAFWMSDKIGGGVFVGLMGILALAASMSTLAAIINVASVLISKDLVGTVVTRMDRKDLFKTARHLTIGVGILAIFIATMNIPNLMFIAIFMYDCSVQAFPIIFLGLYWKKANLPGAFTGLIVGVAWSLLGNISPGTVAWAGGWSGGMVGLFFNFLIMIVFGLFSKKDERVEEIFMTLKTFKDPRISKIL
jgi:solute:Na+ symporter, SSS family